MTIFYSKSLYIGYDLKEFNRIREILNANGINYKYKVNNRMGQFSGTGTVRSQTGSFGVSSDNMYEYEVKVKESDYTKAKYVISSNKS